MAIQHEVFAGEDKDIQFFAILLEDDWITGH